MSRASAHDRQPVAYDEWQLDKIRAALRAHRAYAQGQSGTGLSWLELSADINAYTDVSMTQEVLRQFVEGVSKREYPVRYREPSAQNLEAIVAYLSNPKIDALAAGELDQQRFAWQVPRRLAEFLSENSDPAEEAALMQLEGTYRAALSTDETITVTELTLRHDAENGFIRADETSDIYTNPGTGDVLKWSARQRRTHHRARREAGGWAVLTPEDNILFLLKNRAYGFNHCWTLAAEALPRHGAPVARLILQKHDEPAALENGEAGDSAAGDAIPAALYRHLLGAVFCFNRI